MALEFCTLRAPQRPFSLLAAGSTLTGVRLVAPLTIVWQDGAIDPWVPEGFAVTSVYDGNVAVDTTAFIWLIVAVKGVAGSARLIKEQDYGNLGTTLLAGQTCQALYRIVGTDYEPFQQAGSGGTGLPAGADGTLLYRDPATHQWVAQGGTQGDIWRFENGIWERLPIGSVGDLLHVELGPYGKRPVWIDASLVVTGLPPTIASGLTTKAMTLWNGSGNNTPPTNWDQPYPAFDDSTWASAVLAMSETSGAFQGFPGSHIIWPESPGLARAEQALFRSTFTMITSSIGQALLQWASDGICYEIAINGTSLGSFPARSWPNTPGYPSPTNMDITTHIVAGKNVLAFHTANDVNPPYDNNGDFCFTLSIT